ncbi:Phosphate-binding DING protein (related to PstS) [plant metagenome]|uniref:Phosphate-binding DING protein (Related to PstS) n=1 Tax=plant metagenome TaxID=1297885 RepID=A0A484TC59_9ZZZZ
MNAFNLKKSVAAVVLAGLSMVGAAASAQTVVGGGATLPQPLYTNLINNEFANFAAYVGTGSGTGKTAFVTNNGGLFNATGSSVHYAGSDSALTQANLNTYNTTSGGNWGPVIQIPAVATAVLLPYKVTGQTALDLTDDQICQIFGVADQTWGDVLGTTDATQVRVVYRTEGSGTTELLANYLAAACDGWGFTVSNSFATVVGGALGEPIPSHWIGASGSSGVAAVFQGSQTGVFGYLSPDVNYTGNDNSVVARVNGYLPDAESVQAGIADQAPPSGAAAADPLAWVPAYVQPEVGYPIFGTTNLLVNQCYTSSAVEAEIVDFVTRLNELNDEVPPPATNLITAHNFVQLPGTWNAAIRDTFLSASSSLAIGNATACGSNGRP